MNTPEARSRHYSREDRVDCKNMLQSVLEGDPPIDLITPYEEMRRAVDEIRYVSGTEFDDEASALLNKLQASIYQQQSDLASELTAAIEDSVVSAKLLIDSEWLTVEAITVVDGRLVPVVNGEVYREDIENAGIDVSG